MILAKVIGKIVSVTKNESLNGKKILIVVPLNMNETEQGNEFVSLDSVGAGIGDLVLVTKGSSSIYAFGEKLPIDSAIVAIVDTIE